jgi:hypothetical protein
MIAFTISGLIPERESGLALAGLFVKAFDYDLVFDDLPGPATSDARGRVRITTELSDFRDFFDKRPDLSFRVYSGDPGTLRHTTEHAMR